MKGKKILSLLMCALMLVSMLPVSAFADESCTCGSDEADSHSTGCALYTAPENPQCFCVEKCTEGTVNEWCHVCGVQGAAACKGGADKGNVFVENVAAVTIDEETTEYLTLAKALENISDGAVLSLLQDCSLDGVEDKPGYVHESGSLTIDLNGKTISGSGEPALIHVKGGVLKIVDSSTGGSILENSTDTETTYSCVLVEGGLVEHLDGMIKSENGTAVSIFGEGKYTMGEKPAETDETEPKEENKPEAEGKVTAFYFAKDAGIVLGDVSGAYSVAMETPGKFATALEGVSLSTANFSSAEEGYYIALDRTANTLSLVQGECIHNYVDGICSCGAEHAVASLSPTEADGANGWYKGATLTAPEGYTISATDGGTASNAMAVSDGTYTAIEYWMKNVESGIESKLTMTVSINVDGTAPAISRAEAASVTDNSASVQIEIAEAASGVESIQLVCSDTAVTIGELTDNAFPVSGMSANTAYTFTLTVKDNAGNSASREISLITSKLAASYTAPAAKSGLVYNGEAQELITAGAASGGEMQYSLNGIDYSTAIPAATAAGSYTVWYKVLGDAQHGDIEAACITAEIGKAEPSYTIPAGLSATYGQTLADVTLPEGWSWKDNGSVGNAGSNKFSAMFTPDDTANYSTVEKEIELSVAKKALSITGAVIGEKSYDGQKTASVSSVSLSGLHGSETLSPGTDFTVSAEFNDANIGSDKIVTVSVTLLETAAAKNYSISGSFTLYNQSILENAATPTVSLSFDKVSYNGSEHKPTVTLKIGDTVIPASEYDVVYADNTNAGTAKVTVSDKTGGNYSFGSVERTFVIEKVKLTISPKAVSVTRGANAPKLDYTVTGLISGEKIGANTALEFKLYNSSGTEVTPANAVNTAGTYTIKWTNMNSIKFSKVENYELNKVETANFVVNAPASSTTNNNTGSGTNTNTNNNSSNTNNSSGNNYKPPVASTMKPTTTVPLSGDSKTIRVDVSVYGNTATISSLDLDKLDTVIDERISTGTVSVDFSKLGNGNSISTVKLPTDAVNEIAKAAQDDNNDVESLVIVLSDETSIEFDAAALTQKASQAKGKDISISVEHADKSKTLTAAQKAAVSGHDAYDISVISDGKQISDMGGKVSIHVPYALKSGEKAEGIVVYYVDDKGNMEACETSYDSQNKQVSWKTEHLSVYMIDYVEPLEENPAEGENIGADENTAPENNAPTPIDPEKKDNNDLKAILWIALIGLVLMAGGLMIFAFIRRMKDDN